MKSDSSRIIDYILIIIYLFLTWISFIRFFGAMKSKLPLAMYYVQYFEPYLHDENGPAQMQMISIVYFGVLFFLSMIYYLYYDDDTYLIDYLAIFSGAMAQSQFSYMGSSMKILSTNPEPYFTPIPNYAVFFIVNLLFVLVPNFHLYRLTNLSRIKTIKFK